MMNGSLQDFVCDAVAKGQISYGDVRRLQRDYLPDGITSHEELELLISLNARLARADKTWAQWLVASVAEFVVKREVREHPIEKTAGESLGRLLAASTTSLGRKIARQIRRELGRRPGIQSPNADRPPLEGMRNHDNAQPSQAEAPASDPHDCSLGKTKPRRCRRDKSPARPRPPRRTVRHERIPAAMTLASAAHGWCLAGYLSAVQRSHLMNFQSSRVSLVLAPCR